ncbi:MAG: hypothetical protein AB7F76_05680 [Parvibaculaceae bacterium]
MIRSRIFALALLCSAALPGAALADEAGEKIVRDLIAAIDASPGWSSSAKSVRSEGSTIVVEGWTNAMEDGTVSATTGSLVFDGLAAQAGGGFSAKSVTAKDQKVTSKVITVDIPEITASDVAIPAWQASPFDPEKPVTSMIGYLRMASGQAVSKLSIPSLTGHSEIPMAGKDKPIASTFTYNDFTIENMKAGKIGRQHVGKVTAQTDMPPDVGGPQVIAYENLETIDYDLSALLHVLDPAEYKDGKSDGQWLPATSKSTIGKMSATQGGKPIYTIDGMSFTGLKVRQPAKPIATAVDELVALSKKGGEPDPALLFAALRPLLTFFSIDNISVNGVSVGDPGVGSGKIASITLDKLDPDGLARFAIEGVEGQGPGVAAGLKLLEVNDIGWANLDAYANLMMLETMRSDDATKNAQLVAKAAETAPEAIPRVGSFKVAGVSFSWAGGEPITLDEYSGKLGGFFGNYPMAGEAVLNKLHVPAAILRLEPEIGQILDALQYSDFTAHAGGKSDWDASSGRYGSTTTLSVDQAGSLALSYDLGGLTEPKLKSMVATMIEKQGEPDPGTLMATYGDLSIAGVKFRFEDASLTKRLITFAAKMQGMDEATMVANAGAMLTLGLSQLKHPDFAAKTSAAVNAFLKDPKSFTLTIKPAQPVQVLQLMGVNPAEPGKIIDLLGVSVSAND